VLQTSTDEDDRRQTAKQYWPITCRLVSDQLTRLDVTNTGEERTNVILRHRLRQVVDNQVGLVLLRVGDVSAD